MNRSPVLNMKVTYLKYEQVTYPKYEGHLS